MIDKWRIYIQGFDTDGQPWWAIDKGFSSASILVRWFSLINIAVNSQAFLSGSCSGDTSGPKAWIEVYVKPRFENGGAIFEVQQ